MDSNPFLALGRFFLLFLWPWWAMQTLAWADCDLLMSGKEKRQCQSYLALINLGLKSTVPAHYGDCLNDRFSLDEQDLCMGVQRAVLQLSCDEGWTIPLSLDAVFLCKGIQLGIGGDLKACLSLWPDRLDLENVKKISCLGVAAGVTGRVPQLKGVSLARKGPLFRALQAGFRAHADLISKMNDEMAADCELGPVPDSFPALAPGLKGLLSSPLAILPPLVSPPLPVPPKDPGVINVSNVSNVIEKTTPPLAFKLPPIIKTKKEEKSTYLLRPLEAEYRGEERKGVVYYTQKERERFKVQIKGGRVYNSMGRTFHSMGRGGSQLSIFVMDAQGDIYITNEFELDKLHHSSLMAGAPVAAAGEIVIENGRIRYISNGSGHYRPTREHTEQFLQALRKMGMSLSGVELEIISKGRNKKQVLKN